MKKLLLISIITITSILTWCFKNEPSQLVDFNNFSIEIWTEFTEIYSWLFEWNQIHNNIIKSYKIHDNWNKFNDNLIITTTQVRKEIDWRTFAEVNVDKLRKNIRTLSLIWNIYSNKFTCWNNSIEWFVWKYIIYDNIFDESNKYYLMQYYYVYNWTGYIISFATDNERKLWSFEKYVKSIKCN